LIQVEEGWRRLRAELLERSHGIERGFADAVMHGVRQSPAPVVAAAVEPPARVEAVTGSPRSYPWLTLSAAAAGVLLFVFPLYSRDRDGRFSQACQANLRSIGTALDVYAQNYDDRLPPPGAWRALAAGYTAPRMRSLSPFTRCPGDLATSTEPSYSFYEPMGTADLDDLPARDRLPLVFEASSGRFARRHRRGGNVLFGDGHVQPVLHFNRWPEQ
jgi:prepilin-type processing-associated H-X9-DG protein